MKKVYNSHIISGAVSGAVTVLGWLKARRHHKKLIFLDIVDSTGQVQVVFESGKIPEAEFQLAAQMTLESSVSIQGVVQANPRSGSNEVVANHVEVISPCLERVEPQIRGEGDVFDPALADHLLKHRHLYVRNPKIMAILRFRSLVMSKMRRWFEDNQFLEICAPVLTPVPLYDDITAMPVYIDGEKAFLTQCVGYYLEAAVHAFERVYNMGPSFRGEESRSPRHLMEYWHIKAEMAFGDLEDIIAMVEDIFAYITRECAKDGQEILAPLGGKMCLDGLKTPFPRMQYEDAIARLQAEGHEISFGQGFGAEEEAALSALFDSPFWITGIPRSCEPFPYVIDQKDPRVTRVADLIANNGYGELLGVAEKIVDPVMLDERLAEKGKLDDPRYEWIRQTHRVGCVPHIAVGMGVERLVRWLVNTQHVRDCIPFPRIFRRRIMP